MGICGTNVSAMGAFLHCLPVGGPVASFYSGGHSLVNENEGLFFRRAGKQEIQTRVVYDMTGAIGSLLTMVGCIVLLATQAFSMLAMIALGVGICAAALWTGIFLASFSRASEKLENLEMLGVLRDLPRS